MVPEFPHLVGHAVHLEGFFWSEMAVQIPLIRKTHISETCVCTSESAFWMSRLSLTVVSWLQTTKKTPRTELEYPRLENNKGQ